jgi:dolichol-phosphate mannosyltransferase
MNSPATSLSIIVPTFNESKNISELIRRIEATLGDIAWEVIVVDDDSPDGTAPLVRALAQKDFRIRCVQRINRRGLSSACIEGMLSSSAPILAVMDADMQHDETILPAMLAKIERDKVDLVIGSRYAPGGTPGSWNESRKRMSRLATAASRIITSQPMTDPMSGFFMLRRELFDATVHELTGLGFKILLDILATAKKTPYTLAEVPYQFRDRFAGESKLDEMVIWEYGMLLMEKSVGRYIPVRFLSFALIGGIGVVVHMAVLFVMLKESKIGFATAQSFATGIAMIFNFWLNNIFTYRDRRLKGMAWIKGLCVFVVTCSVGGLANVGISTYLFSRNTQWTLAALSGVLVGAVWNYALTQVYTWGSKGNTSKICQKVTK